MNIGKRIETIRKQRDYRMMFVSEQTGIDQGTLSKIENGKRVPTIAHLERIAQVYKMSVVQLLGGDDAGLTVDEYQLLKAYRDGDWRCVLGLMLQHAEREDS